MENIIMLKNSKKYGFKKGDSFNVLRTIMGECVVIIPNDKIPNLIMSEKKLRSYGILAGEPQIG